MNTLVLILAVITTAVALQIPLAFATLPHGCTGNPHDRDSGPTGNPHDRSSATPSGFEIGNPHDSFRHPFHELHGFPSGDICPGS